MSKQYIESQLTKANNRLCELLQDENLQQLPNYNTLLEEASNKYDYYSNLLNQ
jgi:predicted house-cleaning noncanonical NTP pyrophosphatase (MazG superfamily)